MAFNILIVDDSAIIRKMIERTIHLASVPVGGIFEAENGRDALAILCGNWIDLVFADINMPVMSGLEAIRLIKAENPEVKIVVLTVSDEDEKLFEAIKSGADGYLLKSLESDEFFHLLTGLPRGETPISPLLAAKILQEFAHLQRGKGEETLTEREQEVLRLLAQGALNKEIAAALVISENTVKYHVKNIMEKLHLRNRGQVIAYATRHNLDEERPTAD